MTNAFVYKFIRIFTCLVMLFSAVSAQEKNEKLSEQNSVKKTKLPISASQNVEFFSRKKMDLIKELDEIMREMVWLIRSERPSANKTLFGKVYRALQQVKGTKLIEKNKHSCDQYSVESVTQYQYRIYEYCQKHRAPDLLAKLEWSKNQVSFEFQGQNYADVLGLAASLVAPTILCKIEMTDAIKLVNFTCSGFRITRADNVARFEILKYTKGKEPLMYLKGEVLKNLLPYSDLTISVPITGKVKVLEKKKAPDMDETTPEMKEKMKIKSQPMPEPVPVPVDPRAPLQAPPPQGPPPYGRGTQKVPTAPRDELQAVPPTDQNNDLLKNSDPDVIPIEDPNYTR